MLRYPVLMTTGARAEQHRNLKYKVSWFLYSVLTLPNLTDNTLGISDPQFCSNKFLIDPDFKLNHIKNQVKDSVVII